MQMGKIQFKRALNTRNEYSIHITTAVSDLFDKETVL